MSNHIALGKKGESVAADYLKRNGYAILELNWRTGRAEVDIIAEKDNEIIIVEVKTRKSRFFGEPEISVDDKKKNMLCKAAGSYIEEHNLDKPIRFDIISIVIEKGQIIDLHHFDDAFFIME